jgi:hypothetical protein
VEVWRREQVLEIIEGYGTKNYNADETRLVFRLPLNKTLSCTDPCNGVSNSKERITVLLACDSQGTDRLPPLVTGKREMRHCFKNARKLCKKHVVNRKEWLHRPFLLTKMSKW